MGKPANKCKSPFLLEVLSFLKIKTVLFSYEHSSLMSLRKIMTLCFIQLFILVTCSCSSFLHPRHRHYIYCWILINVVWSYLSSLFLEIFFNGYKNFEFLINNSLNKLLGLICHCFLVTSFYFLNLIIFIIEYL